ncbi:hypothetical protein DITRI_Ditri02bG0170000 [Diplodiscus trichospermus]
MADAFFLDAVGTLLVKYAVEPVERRVRYLFRLNKIVEELHEQEKNLTKEQTRVREDVEEAKRHTQTHVIEKNVEDWLREAETVLNDVQSLEHRVKENKKCFPWCPNWCCRYQLSKKIEQKTLAIRKLIGSSNFDRVGHRAELPDIEFSSEGYLVSKSATDAFNKIMEALKEEGVNMIGVWGMGGVGKTILVTKVGKEAKSLQLFNPVIKVVVSQATDIGKIQHKIADCLDLKFRKTTEEGKAAELCLHLEKKEKVLIILDDMWNELDLKKIGILFSEKRKGCKIIFTTRHKQVCNYMKSQVTVPLDVLDKDEAWTLFKMNASLENASPDIINVAKEVAKECGGLPIAIVTLAKALRSKDLNDWQLALRKLEESRLTDIDDVQDEADKNVYFCLKTSYDHLRSKMTRKCFLLCALYPEDYLIDVEDLVRHAWGLMLYPNADSIDNVRSEVLAAINFLKDSCLLLEADGKRYVKVHDVTRDVALWIASKEDNGLVITKSRVGAENENSKQKLEILLVDNYDSKAPIGFFDGMPELKVLSLRTASALEDGFLSLNAIKSLPNLRALQLKDFWQLEDISVLAKLTKLEILSLHNSGVQESVYKLRELKNLRLLDIKDSGFKSGFPPKLIQKLVNLEEIYLHYSTGGFREVSTTILLELNFLPKLTTLLLHVPPLHVPQDFVFPRLERYSIATIHNNSLSSSKAIMSRSLGVSNELSLNMFLELFWNVEFLQVSKIREKDIKCLTDTTPWNVPVATILKNLKAVSIEDCKNLQVIFRMKKAENQVLLSKLEELCLSQLPDLEYIWKMPTQHLSLKSLEAVKIDSCGKLKSLFSLSLAQSLVHLKELEINGCGEMEQIVKELKDDEQEISPKSLCLPKLRSLKINYCNSLEYIFPNFMASQGLPQLQELSMMDLSQLKQICRYAQQREENGILESQLQLSPSLTQLELKACPELTGVHSEPVEACLAEIQISKLKEVLFVNMKKLYLKRIIGDHNLIPEVDREGLNELTSLELKDCSCLKYLVDTTEHVPNTAFGKLVELQMEELDGLKTLCNGQFPNGFLPNLEKLRFERCRELQYVLQIDDLKENQPQVLSNLGYLELSKLPALRWILKGSAHYFGLQSLKVVNISECKKLKSLFSPSHFQSLQQLNELEVKDCEELKALFAELETDGETESESHLHPLCLPRLTTLRVSSCGSLQYVLPITLTQGLLQLEKFEIERCDDLKTVFGELESDRETDSNSHLHPLSLPKLKTLDVGECPTLEYVLPIPLAEGLPQLELVSIWNCPQLKQVFSVVKQEDQDVQHCIKLPCLEDLELYNLTNLISFAPQNYFVKAPVLEKLSVADCPQLMKFRIDQQVNDSQVHLELAGKVRLFAFEEFLRTTEHLFLYQIFDPENLQLTGEDLKRCLSQNLKNLAVRYCKNLEIIQIGELFLYNMEENQAPLLSNLEYLKLHAVTELRWICKGPTQYVSLRSLKVVSIYKCNKLESLFSSSLIPSLRLLEELGISYCDNLEMVFTELESECETKTSDTPCLPNLKTLEIFECATLKYVLPLAPAQGLLCLQTLKLVGLRNLSSFGPEIYFLGAPALKIFEVSDCPGLSNFTIQQHKRLQSKEHRHNDVSSSKRYIHWAFDDLTSQLPPYVEEGDGISTLE